MAKNTPTPSKKYIGMTHVNSYLLGDNALIGNVVHKSINGQDHQYLILADSHGEVVGVHSLDSGKFSCDRPMLILGSEGDPSCKIQPGYYTGTQMYTVINSNEQNAMPDVFYSVNFGNNSNEVMSNFERVSAYSRALELLDDRAIVNSPELNAYLTQAARVYNETTMLHRDGQRESYTDDPYGIVRQQTTETRELLYATGTDSFTVRMRDASIDMYMATADSVHQNLTIRAASLYSSEFERTAALHDLQVADMRNEFYSNSKILMSKFGDDLARDGIIDYVGVDTHLAYSKLSTALATNQSQLQLMNRGESESVIAHRAEYITALTNLVESHPYLVQGKHSDVSSYHFMADQSIYTSSLAHMGAHGYAADQASQHSLPLYGDKSQHEYFDREVARSAVLSVVTGPRSKNMMDIYQSTTVPHAVDADYRAAHGLVEGQPWSVSDRRDYIAERIASVYLSDAQSKNAINADYAREYMMSAEFASILANRDSLYIHNKEGKTVSINVNGDVVESEAAQLRPEFAVKWHIYDMSSPESCAELQKELEKQAQIDSKLHERPSVELAEGLRFIRDYISFNENTQSSEYNLVMSRGLSTPRVEYGSMTLEILNSSQYAQSADLVRMLNDKGHSVDFTSVPSIERMYANYSAMQYGLAELETMKVEKAQELHDAIAKMGHAVDTGATPSFDRVIQILRSTEEDYDARKRAEEIAEAVGVKLNPESLSIKELSTIASLLSDEEVQEMRRIYNMESTCKTLTDSLSEDIKRQELLITSSLDEVREKTEIVQVETKSDPMFDIKAALALNPENKVDAINNVLDHLEAQNKFFHAIHETAKNPDLREQTEKVLIEQHDVIKNGSKDEYVDVVSTMFKYNANDPIQRDVMLKHRDKIIELSSEAVNGTLEWSTMKTRFREVKGVSETRYIVDHRNEIPTLDIARVYDKAHLAEVASTLGPDVSHELKVALERLHTANATHEELFTMQNVYHYNNPTNAANEVINNLESRNAVIEQMQHTLDNPQAKALMYNHLSQNSEILANGSENDYVRIVSSAFNVHVTPENYAVVRATILESREDVERIMREMSSDHVDALGSKSVITMHKTEGLDDLREVIRLSPPGTIDYERLMDRNYLEYLSTTNAAQTNPALADALNGAIESNRYLDVVVVQRNVEELTHRCDLSKQETDNMLQVARQLTYAAALSEGTEQFDIRKAQYDNLIDVAANQNSTASEHLTASLNETRNVIVSNMHEFEQNFPGANRSVTEMPTTITLESDGRTHTNHQYGLTGVIVEPDNLYEVRSELESSIKNNRFYSEYVDANNNSQKHIELAEIQAKIQKYEEDLTQCHAIHEQYSEKAQGLFGSLRYGRTLHELEGQAQMYEFRIESLRDQEQKLILSMKEGYGQVPDALIDSNREFRMNANAETARTFVIDTIREYGQDTTLRTAETRDARIYSYSNAELLEAMIHTNPNISVKEDYYRAGIQLADATLDDCVKRAEVIRQSSIDKLSEEIRKVNPEGSTVVTPDLVQTIIDGKTEQLNAATPEQQMTLQSEIKHLEEIKEQLIELNSLDVRKDNLTEVALVLSQHEPSAVSIAQEGASAEIAIKQFETQLQELNEFDKMLQAYKQLEIIRDATSTLAREERIIVAQEALGHQNTIDAKNICAVIDAIPDNERTKAFADAFSRFHDQSEGIKVLFERMDKPGFAPNERDIAAMRTIDAYNSALSNLTAEDRQAIMDRVIVQYSGVDNAENRQLIENFALTEISGHNVKTIIQEYHDEIYPPTLMQEYNRLEPSEKSDLVYRCFAQPVVEEQEAPTTHEMKLATIAIAESGYGAYAAGFSAENGQGFVTGNNEEIQSKMADALRAMKEGDEHDRQAFEHCREKISHAEHDSIEARAIESLERDATAERGFDLTDM